MDERARVASTFGRYRRSRRKQRAWAAGRPGNVAIRDEAAGRIDALAGTELSRGDVLDMGCGSGWWLERLASAGVQPERLHGVDVLPDRVRSAAERVPQATLQVADVRRLPFTDGRFSVVSMLLVLSSLADRAAIEAALHEALRVRSVNGVIVIWEPRISNPLNRSANRVPEKLVAEVLGPPSARTTLTLLPPLARQLRRREQYTRFAKHAVLHTHRLTLHRARFSDGTDGASVRSSLC